MEVEVACAQRIVLLKLTTDIHEASHGLSATAQLSTCFNPALPPPSPRGPSDITNTEFVTYIQYGKFCYSIGRPKAFSFRGLRPPDPLTRCSAPGFSRWGISPQTSGFF